MEYAPLHITGLYALGLKPSGSAKPQSAQAPLWDFAPPHFCNPAKPTVSLIRVAKTSHTTGTVYDILLNIMERLGYWFYYE